MSRTVARILGIGLIVLVMGFRAGAEDENGLITRGKQLFFEKGCYGCHTVGLMGTPIAPDLARVGSKYPRTYFARWLRDPSAQRSNAHMPKLDLSEAEIQALTAYLSSLR